jgi:poly(A) polymerase Pap1
MRCTLGETAQFRYLLDMMMEEEEEHEEKWEGLIESKDSQ